LHVSEVIKCEFLHDNQSDVSHVHRIWISYDGLLLDFKFHKCGFYLRLLSLQRWLYPLVYKIKRNTAKKIRLSVKLVAIEAPNFNCLSHNYRLAWKARQSFLGDGNLVLETLIFLLSVGFRNSIELYSKPSAKTFFLSSISIFLCSSHIIS
jgi:hypothetical protein